MAEKWLTVAQAADHFKVHGKTIRRLVEAGRLPSYRLSRLIRLKQTDLDSFLEAHRNLPGCEGAEPGGVVDPHLTASGGYF